MVSVKRPKLIHQCYSSRAARPGFLAQRRRTFASCAIVNCRLRGKDCKPVTIVEDSFARSESADNAASIAENAANGVTVLAIAYDRANTVQILVETSADIAEDIAGAGTCKAVQSVVESILREVCQRCGLGKLMRNGKRRTSARLTLPTTEPVLPRTPPTESRFSPLLTAEPALLRMVFRPVLMSPRTLLLPEPVRPFRTLLAPSYCGKHSISVCDD